jgi:hypothetical protein
MEVALHRRLEGVAHIAISQSRQTVEVAFAPGPYAFSPAAFREAVDEAGVEVLSFRIEACGVIEQEDGVRWLAAGRNRFLLAEAVVVGGAGLTDGEVVCVSGSLEDRSRPGRLEITGLEFVSD